MEDIGSAAKLAAKRLAGVALQVNYKEHACIHEVQTRLPTLALETQRRHHQVQNRGISGNPEILPQGF